MNEIDQKVYDAYMKDALQNDPATYKLWAGVPPEMAYQTMKDEHDFTDVSKAVLGMPIGEAQYAKQHPVQTGIENALTGPTATSISNAAIAPVNAAVDAYQSARNAIIGDKAGNLADQALYAIPKAVNRNIDISSKALGDYGDRLLVQGEPGITGALKAEAGRFLNATALGLGLAKLPADPHSAGLAMLMGAATPAINSVRTTSFEPPVLGKGGMLAPKEVPIPPQSEYPRLTLSRQPEVPESLQFAKEKGFDTPVRSGIDAQNIVAQLKDANKAYVNRLYSDLDPLKQSAEGQTPIDVSPVVNELTKIVNESGDLAKEFKNKTIQNLVKGTADTLQKGQGVDASPADLIDARTYLNSMYEKNWDNPVGNVASRLSDAIDKTIKSNAPDSISSAYSKATEAYADHAKTYYNPEIQSFSKTTPENLTNLNWKQLQAVKRAGGAEAIESLRSGSGYDLLQRMYASNDPGGLFAKEYVKNPDLYNELYGRDTIQKIADAGTELQHHRAILENMKQDWEAQARTGTLNNRIAKAYAEAGLLKKIKILAARHAASSVGSATGFATGAIFGHPYVGSGIGGWLGDAIDDTIRPAVDAKLLGEPSDVLGALKGLKKK